MKIYGPLLLNSYQRNQYRLAPTLALKYDNHGGGQAIFSLTQGSWDEVRDRLGHVQ